MKKILILLAVMLLLVSCGEKSINDINNDDSETKGDDTAVISENKEFIPVFRFVVCSDVHFKTYESAESERFAQLFKSSYKYSSEHAHYNTVDALVIVGDFTDNGSKAEYELFNKVLNANVKEETTVMTVMGNHEYGNGSALYKSMIDENLNKHITVNGYHFIGLSPAGYDGYGSSAEWLKTELGAAEADDPDKPIITFQHHHIKDTVYVSKEWYTQDSVKLDDIYKDYSQIINFSGHSHGPVNNPTSIWQTTYTTLGTGTLSYFEMMSGMTYGTVPPNSNQAAQFYIVEVDADNSVRILPYNLLTDDFFKHPSLDNDSQLIYTIDDLKDPSTFKYTDKRFDTAAAPYFKEGAELSVSDIKPNSVTLTIPQAYDDECVYGYTINCFEKESGDLINTYKYFSEYYFEPMPAQLTYSLWNFAPDTEYTIEVYAVNVYDKKSENSLTVSFKTEYEEPVVYTSENDVNFTNTFTNFDSLTNPVEASSSFVYGTAIDGDYYIGNWSSSGSNGNGGAEIADGKGYDNSSALGVWANTNGNQAIYIFATEANKNPTIFPERKYLRVWVDFTDTDFRKANFGLISDSGALYSTDEIDGSNDLSFYYLKEGSETWVEYKHGTDGCFGTAQNGSVKGFKGWMAFPVKDFAYRSGTGSGMEFSGSYPYSKIAGVYMFWDYDSASYADKKFYLDEIHLVDDYMLFVK